MRKLIAYLYFTLLILSASASLFKEKGSPLSQKGPSLGQNFKSFAATTTDQNDGTNFDPSTDPVCTKMIWKKTYPAPAVNDNQCGYDATSQKTKYCQDITKPRCFTTDKNEFGECEPMSTTEKKDSAPLACQQSRTELLNA